MSVLGPCILVESTMIFVINIEGCEKSCIHAEIYFRLYFLGLSRLVLLMDHTYYRVHTHKRHTYNEHPRMNVR